MSLIETLSNPVSPVSTNRLKYWSWWLPLFAAGWVVVLYTAFPQPTDLFQRHWPLILVGVGGALLGNATAVGGGLVFIPVLIMVYQVEPVQALKLSLATQAFGMTSGALGWLRRGVVPLTVLGWCTPALLLGATIGTLLIHPSGLLVKALFGPVSILVGLLTLYLVNRPGHGDTIPGRAALPLVAVALVGGLLTAWIAIGEGEIVAAFLMLAYGLRADRGIGLGVVLMALGSIYLTLLHQVSFGDIPWDKALFTLLGAVYGARLAPYLTQNLNPRTLKLIFAGIAIADGAIFSLQSFLA